MKCQQVLNIQNNNFQLNLNVTTANSNYLPHLLQTTACFIIITATTTTTTSNNNYQYGVDDGGDVDNGDDDNDGDENNDENDTDDENFMKN